jgi:hypothetical protein
MDILLYVRDKAEELRGVGLCVYSSDKDACECPSEEGAALVVEEVCVVDE